MKKTILLVLVCLFVVAGLSAGRVRAYTQQIAALGSELPNQQFPDVTATSTQTAPGYLVTAIITARPLDVLSTATHIPSVIRLFRFGNGTTMPYSTRIYIGLGNFMPDWNGGETIRVTITNNNVEPAKTDFYEYVIPNNLTSALTVTDPIPVFDLWPAAPTGIEVVVPPAVGETIVGDGTNGFEVGVVITGGGSVPPELLGGDFLLPAVMYTITATGTQDVVVHKPAAYAGEWYCWMLKGGVLTPAVPNPLAFDVLTYTFVGVDFDAKGDAQIILNDNPTLPVTLSSFAATLTAQNFVKLTWVSQTETGLAGYRVLRSETNDFANAIAISQLIDATNTSSTQTYTHEDKEVSPANTYYYWLESVEMNGTSDFHGPTNVYVEPGQNITPSLITTMGNAYPNPFKANSNTNIAYEVKAGETGTITIYNIIGQVVKTVPVTETTTPRTFTWNGRDSKGNVCGSGIYFYKLSTPSRNITKKMVIAN